MTAVVALLSIVPVFVFDTATFSSSAPASATGAVQPGWEEAFVDWDVYAVGPHERSLQLVFTNVTGDCRSARNERARAHETRTTVSIEFTKEVSLRTPGVLCALSRRLMIGTTTLPLARPLAGRTIRGRRGVTPGVRPFLGERTPGLIGFSPHDAEHALGLWHLKGRILRVRRTAGLRRVVAQSPAGGHRRPQNELVRLRVAD
jgi:hypothetical protein